MTGLRLSIVMKTASIELKPIPVSPNDDYRAGSDGRIYSRTKYAGFGKKAYVDWYPLTGHKTKKGYFSISLCHENRKVTKSVHRLVCLAFHGIPTPSTLQARHLDGDPSNNKPENLNRGTQVENWQDREAHGRGMKGERHHSSKLTDEGRAALKWAVKMRLCSRRHAARILGMSQAAVSRICLGLKE